VNCRKPSPDCPHCEGSGLRKDIAKHVGDSDRGNVSGIIEEMRKMRESAIQGLRSHLIGCILVGRWTPRTRPSPLTSAHLAAIGNPLRASQHRSLVRSADTSREVTMRDPPHTSGRK